MNRVPPTELGSPSPADPPSHPERPSPRRGSPLIRIRSGFTLIELMIVISIVAIIIAMGVPAFVRGLRKEGLRKAVSDMVEGCSHARAQAILHGLPTELLIRAEDGQIAVRPASTKKPEDGAEPLRFGTENAPTPALSSTFKANLPEDIAVKLLYVNFKDQMEFPEAHVRFFPNGTSDEFTIILSSNTGEQQISLDVITGLAEVKTIR